MHVFWNSSLVQTVATTHRSMLLLHALRVLTQYSAKPGALVFCDAFELTTIR